MQLIVAIGLVEKDAGSARENDEFGIVLAITPWHQEFGSESQTS